MQHLAMDRSLVRGTCRSGEHHRRAWRRRPPSGRERQRRPRAQGGGGIDRCRGPRAALPRRHLEGRKRSGARAVPAQLECRRGSKKAQAEEAQAEKAVGLAGEPLAGGSTPGGAGMYTSIAVRVRYLKRRKTQLTANGAVDRKEEEVSAVVSLPCSLPCPSSSAQPPQRTASPAPGRAHRRRGARLGKLDIPARRTPMVTRKLLRVWRAWSLASAS